MTAARLLRKTSYVWLLFALISAGATVYFTYRFFAVYRGVLHEARENARQDTLSASHELGSFITILKPLAESIADEISSKKMSKEQIETFIHGKKTPAIAGVGVAFLPSMYDKETKLYAPYLSEIEGKVSMVHLEDLYDYTKPEYGWFHEPIKHGTGGFIEPYYGQASKTILVEYSVPFYQTDAQGKKRIAGIVYANQNVEHLKHVLDTLFLGKTGYWFIITKKGVFLSHPQSQFAHRQMTLFELANQLKNPALAKVAEKITNQEEVFFEYNNEITGAPSWLFSEPIEGTRWSIVGVFDKGELDIKPIILRHQFIFPAIALLFFIIMLSLWVLTFFDQENPTQWWIFSFLVAVAFACFVFWIWYANIRYPTYLRDLTYSVENKVGLFEYLRNESVQRRYGVPIGQYEEVIPHKKIKQDLPLAATSASNPVFSEEGSTSVPIEEKDLLQKGFYDARFLPTGIFINNLNFVSSNQVELSAYVWQRYVDGLHDNIPRGMMFPQATDMELEEISRIKEGNAEVILWSLRGTLNQFFNFKRYPFDTKAIHLQLWHRYSTDNIILVPDLNAYKLINPRSLPGIDDDVHIPGWNLVATYFGYRMVNYSSNLGSYKIGPFGVYDATDKSGLPELYFDLLLTRHLIDTMVSDLLPIAVIAFLLFVILLTSPYQGYAVIPSCASVFFAAIVSHMRFREKIPRAQVVYFESFYFMLYVAIILILLVAILYKLEFDIPFIRYRNNIISQLLYWPLLLMVSALITMVYLY